VGVLSNLVDRFLDPDAKRQPPELAQEPETDPASIPPDEGDSGTAEVPSGEDV
jgi:hypothetical protein